MKRKILLSLPMLALALTAMSINKVEIMPRSVTTPSDSVVVSTVDLLKLAIKNSTSDRLILLSNCTDSLGYYKLGTVGIDYPSTFVSLTIRAATGQNPIIYGSFGSTATARMKVKSLTFENLTFRGVLTDLAENNHPFYLTSNDTVKLGLLYKKCKFQDLGGSSTGPRIFYAKNCTLAMLKSLVYDGCTFNNYGGAVLDGATGQHFLQFGAGTYECDSIVLKNSIISDFHGSQFINFGKDKLTPRKDSTVRIIVENNSFIRFGGNATSLRNFVEWTKVIAGQKNQLTIKNNMFYKRWGKNKPNCQLALHTLGVGETLTVNVLNNYFEPDTVVNLLPVSAGTPTTINRVNLTQSSLNIRTATFVNDTLFIMSTNSPLFTAGTNGSPVGAPSMYSSNAVQVVSIDKSKANAKKLTGYTNGDMVFVRGTEKPVTIYNVLGQSLGMYKAEEAVRGIAIHTKGIVIINSNNETIRLMVQ